MQAKSRGIIASLKGEDVDWQNGTVSFYRKKTGVPVMVHVGSDALNLLKDLPSEGPLFPYLSGVRAGDRATEFKQRCQQLQIQGATIGFPKPSTWHWPGGITHWLKLWFGASAVAWRNIRPS